MIMHRVDACDLLSEVIEAQCWIMLLIYLIRRAYPQCLGLSGCYYGALATCIGL